VDLSIVILNWNSAQFLRKCLASLRANSSDLPCEVIVVDNASYDGSAAMVGQEFPEAIFIQNTQNSGFARGNNLGAASSHGDLLLFLNPDTEVAPGALEEMISALSDHPRAGAAGCRLLNSDGTIQTSCLQAYPTILGEVLDSSRLRRWFPRWRIWGNAALLFGTPVVAPVECVSGACLMIRREVFEAVDGFSPDYFMYVEDRDLCYKVHRAGFETVYVGAARVIHHGGTSSDSRPESNFAIVMRCQSLLTFMRIRRGALHARAYRFAMTGVALIRLALLAALSIVFMGGAGRRKVRNARHKWASILRWAIGLESWVETYPLARGESQGGVVA
jgi:GT2 family glycosyltransferase